MKQETASATAIVMGLALLMFAAGWNASQASLLTTIHSHGAGEQMITTESTLTSTAQNGSSYIVHLEQANPTFEINNMSPSDLFWLANESYVIVFIALMLVTAGLVLRIPRRKH